MKRMIWLAVVVLLSAACSGDRPDPAEAYPRMIRFDGHAAASLDVAVASTDVARQHGLMGVRSLPQNAGMAFVWTKPTEAAFWMKDTLIPLSIAFVDDTGRILTIRDMQPCGSDPCPLYRSDGPFVLAIEANAGWFDRHGVSVGDRATLEGA